MSKFAINNINFFGHKLIFLKRSVTITYPNFVFGGEGEGAIQNCTP